MPLRYANQFSVIYEPDGTSLITIGDTANVGSAGDAANIGDTANTGDTGSAGNADADVSGNRSGLQRYLLVPEGMEEPSDLDADIVVLHQPLDCVYLAASSAMDFYRALGKLDQVRFTSTKASDWSMEEVVLAMENGEILYAGKYSAPDYEWILSEEADIAIESTMIYHSPETKEQLERLGIPVLVERSSYEKEPLGRLEWIKLYGLLGGFAEEADAFFEEEAGSLQDILFDTGKAASGRSAAFFYISPNGYAVVRRSTDYVAKIIEMAGGTYIPQDGGESEESALSTMNMEMESFFEAARDADVIFYNSSIDTEITTMEELLSKSSLLGNFRAVQNGEVWCTGKNLFQQVTCIAGMIREMNMILNQAVQGEDLTYFSPVVTNHWPYHGSKNR